MYLNGKAIAKAPLSRTRSTSVNYQYRVTLQMHGANVIRPNIFLNDIPLALAVFS